MRSLIRRSISIGFWLVLTAQVSHGQTINAEIINQWPDERYQDNGNGTVTDKKTGLMWKKCVEGLSGTQCNQGEKSTYSWDKALAAAGELNAQGGFAGYTDWRVPNIKELASLAAMDRYSPAINQNVFPNTPDSAYWSSTPEAYGPQKARAINFFHGLDLLSARWTNTYLLRLVRDAAN